MNKKRLKSKLPAKKHVYPKKTFTKATKGNKKPASAVETKPKSNYTEDQHVAALKIQCFVRGSLARIHVKKKRAAKSAFEQRMKQLEIEAFAKAAKIQQEQYLKECEEENKKRALEKERKKRVKRMLEAAYDGDLEEIKNLLFEVEQADKRAGLELDVIGKSIQARHIMEIIECEDPNGNTPLSEAASGGDADVIKFLLMKGANPNAIGQFDRTPLFRAAFGGHLEGCQILLQHGADPRLYACDGQTAIDVSANNSVTEFLKNWDISLTEKQIERLEREKLKRNEEHKARLQAEEINIEKQLQPIEAEFKAKELELKNCYIEYNKRVEEHDLAVMSNFHKVELTLQAIESAEGDLESAKIAFEEILQKKQMLNSNLRQKKHEIAGVEEKGENLPGIRIHLRELDEVLIRDVGDHIKNSGKWPFIIDVSGRSSVFLKYRDTNYLNALSPMQMEPNKIRIALLGALRYGKSVVLDMANIDMFDTISDRFDEIQSNLMESLMDKSLITEKKFYHLIRKEDGDEYEENKFSEFYMQNFCFIILSTNEYPSPSLLERTYPIRINPPT